MKKITMTSTNGKHTVRYGVTEKVCDSLSEAWEQVFIFNIERRSSNG